jgi:hypothetical protein
MAEQLLSPLQRKRKRVGTGRGQTTRGQKALDYGPKLSTIKTSPGRTHKGLPLTVEGREPITQQRISFPNARSGKENEDTRPGLGGMLQAWGFNKKEKEKYDLAMATRTAEDTARSKLKPVVDPEAGEAARRKKAARRRMRGRAGTILSDNTQSLGVKGTVG